MANVLRSEFLGATLQRKDVSHAKPAEKVQTQALFQKKAKKVEQKAGGLVKQAKKQVSQVQKTATKQTKKVTKQAKSVAGSKKTKGWLGNAGGAEDLDRWYGK